MTPIRFNKKQDFIDALTERRGIWAKWDAAQLAQHKQDEKAALAKFREDCRAAVKLSYRELMGEADEYGYHRNRHRLRSVHLEAPSCPVPEVRYLDNILAGLEATRQQQFTVTRNGQWSKAYTFLTKDPFKVDGPVC